MRKFANPTAIDFNCLGREFQLGGPSSECECCERRASSVEAGAQSTRVGAREAAHEPRPAALAAPNERATGATEASHSTSGSIRIFNFASAARALELGCCKLGRVCACACATVSAADSNQRIHALERRLSIGCESASRRVGATAAPAEPRAGSKSIRAAPGERAARETCCAGRAVRNPDFAALASVGWLDGRPRSDSAPAVVQWRRVLRARTRQSNGSETQLRAATINSSSERRLQWGLIIVPAPTRDRRSDR